MWFVAFLSCGDQPSLSTGAVRIGFLAVSASLTSWCEVLMGRLGAAPAAPMRERLIGLMRHDAALLVQAASAHINAVTDEEPMSENQAMDVILNEIQESSESYAADVPKDGSSRAKG